MKIIGHAGAKGLAPGNTLAAFAKAIEFAVEEIELDVQVSADNVPVLLHDTTYRDQSGNYLQVSKSAMQQLKQHKSDLTTLEEAIAYINHRLPLYIEIKRRVKTEPIIKLLHRQLENGWKASEFRIGSYDLEVLRAMHKAFPDIQIIVIEDWSSIRAHRRAQELGTNRLSMLEYWLWPGFISAMSHRGYELYCFHTYHPKSRFREKLYAKIGLVGQANNPAKAKKWAKYGLAGVITDYPDRFKRSIT